CIVFTCGVSIMSKWVVLASITVAALAGCGDNGTGPDDDESVVGSYDLRTINGVVLPYPLILVANYRLEYASGVLLLAEDMRFLAEDVTREQVDGVTTRTDTIFSGGGWTSADGTVRLKDDRGPPDFEGAKAANTLTLTITISDSTYIFGYQKR
ncbi:MAG TPA: hypothetical protein VK864_02315, partial [Longimicrobiales bacterium]|nr:hypothetical protein [Longimicrobiales bacterium]